MLKQNIIKPSSSPWASPIVVVKKKDGRLRLCIDYRRLNAVTVKDSFPLPRVDKLFDTLAGATYFSTLDLASGYWQVEVDEKDRPKTAFSMPSGLYEFQTMPFGLANAPATFQRLMQFVLQPLIPARCSVYLDDVIVHGKDKADHLRNLKAVLQRLKEVGLKLQAKKCCFMQREVKFLGHIISERGVMTDPGKVTAVREWPTPKSCEEVRSFMGLASYYRRFVHNFAKIATPLCQLLQKDAKFVWTADHQAAFNELRNKLCNTPILTLPDLTRPGGSFILNTNASDSSIEAVLSRKTSEGYENVIAYASRTLSQREMNYCVTRREMLALVEFIKQFRHYLLGKHFLVRTDHQSL